MLSSLFSQPAAITTVMVRKPRKSTYTDPMFDKLKQCTTEEADDLLNLYLHDFYDTITGGAC